MKYHVHGGDDIRQSFLLFAIEGGLLQDLMILNTLDLFLHIEESLAEESCRTTSRVIDRLVTLGINHLDDAANQGARCVILTTIAACITHALDVTLIKHRHLVLILSTLEVEFINHVDDLAHIESGTNLVVQFAKDLANLIFKAIRLSRSVLNNRLHQIKMREII